MIEHRTLEGIDRVVHPTVVHRTLIGPEQSDKVEVWYQTGKPGKPTPRHWHPGEEIIVVFEGEGYCETEDERCEFGPGSVLRVPPRVVHRIGIRGERDLVALAILETPVEVLDREGKPISLPWSYGNTPGLIDPTPAAADR